MRTITNILTLPFILLSGFACGASDVDGVVSDAAPDDQNSSTAEATETESPITDLTVEELESAESDSYDVETLDAYRAAVPAADRVEVVVPGPEAQAGALTQAGDAELARLAVGSAVKINFPARAMVGLLRTIVSLPPSLYNSQEQRFVWGPWDNDDGHGRVFVTIERNDEGADFEYSYSFVRLAGRDLATAQAVIWGAATPDLDDPDAGVGVTLWDFEASHAFDEAHDPDFDPDAARTRGRFAQVYGQGTEDGDEFTFNVAVFRDFLPDDAADDDEPADLDYFFGRIRDEQDDRLHFVDWSLEGDLCDADAERCFENDTEADAAETLGLRAAFINRGIGRAEATLSGGDLSEELVVVECWDDAVDRTYMGVSEDGTMLGEEGACQGPFTDDLETLGVPSLDDVDADILEKMDCVAVNGIRGCDD